jgi:hypothetical protein
MFTALDLVQSTIFGGAILLLVLQLNSSLTDSYTEQSSSVITQQNSIDAGSIITNDLAKMGYMVPAGTPVITHADTLGNMVFRADINHATPWVDSIKYQVVKPADGRFFRIQRIVNANTPTKIYVNVDSMTVTYYKASGARIPVSLLATQAGRDSIRSISVYMRFSDALASASTANQLGECSTKDYKPMTMFWEKRISPRNLQTAK